MIGHQSKDSLGVRTHVCVGSLPSRVIQHSLTEESVVVVVEKEQSVEWVPSLQPTLIEARPTNETEHTSLHVLQTSIVNMMPSNTNCIIGMSLNIRGQISVPTLSLDPCRRPCARDTS